MSTDLTRIAEDRCGNYVNFSRSCKNREEEMDAMRNQNMKLCSVFQGPVHGR